MPAALLIPSVLKNPECQMFRLTAMYCPVTLFDDGLCLLTPTLIFRGKGFRMSKVEKSTWDKRVKVLFQEKAWYDENVMKCWNNKGRANMFFNSATPKSSGTIL